MQYKLEILISTSKHSIIDDFNKWVKEHPNAKVISSNITAKGEFLYFQITYQELNLID